ncbi:hypothetical protein ACQEU3_11830 [Spirillospora sp. CA-253888]
MPVQTLLLRLLGGLFPTWDIWICDRGIWRAAGATLISASTCEALLHHLAAADPDALRVAARKLPDGIP